MDQVLFSNVQTEKKKKKNKCKGLKHPSDRKCPCPGSAVCWPYELGNLRASLAVKRVLISSFERKDIERKA